MSQEPPFCLLVPDFWMLFLVLALNPASVPCIVPYTRLIEPHAHASDRIRNIPG